jgi:hypothetical protein
MHESKKFLPQPGIENRVKLNFSGNSSGSDFIESIWFKVLIGSAVALGTTAAYYKIKADNKYQEYEETGDQALLDQTEQFDIYSGAAFAALQLNFGILIYFFLSN